IARRGPLFEWTALILALVLISSAGGLLGSILIVWLGLGQWVDFWSVLRLCIFFAVVSGVTIRTYDGLRRQLAATELQLRTEELERERAIKLATESRLASLEA